MKRTLFIVLAVIAIFLVIGFSFNSLISRQSDVFQSAPSFGMGGGAAATQAPAAVEAPLAMPAEDAARNSTDLYSTGPAAQVAQERIVIQNADLTIVVKDPKTRMREISDLAREFKGFVVSSNMYQSYTSAGKQVPQGTIVIRVPADRLDEALDRIKEGAVDIQNENRSGQDVTSQYVDLKAQLTAKQAAEKKLLEIMDQATRAEDVLNAYAQIQAVETEIEQLKGQIKYLEESAALSAISVQLIAEESTQPIEVGPWKPEGAAKQAIQDLIYFSQRFVDFLIRFVLLTLPSLVLIAVPLFLLYLIGRAVYRRVRKPRAEVVEVKDVDLKK
jgi:hypothetical protein